MSTGANINNNCPPCPCPCPEPARTRYAGEKPRPSSWKLEKSGANARRFITGIYAYTTFEENSEEEKNGLINQKTQILQVTKPKGFLGYEEKYTFKVLDNGTKIEPKPSSEEEKKAGFDNTIEVNAYNDWDAYRQTLKLESVRMRGGKNNTIKKRKTKKTKKTKKSKKRTLKR
jgi:hypothetical protein